MSLLSDLFDALVAWVRDFVAATDAALRSWVDGLVAAINERIDWLRGQWDNFTSEILPSLWAALENLRKDLGDWLTSLQGSWDEFTSKTLPDLWAAITEAANKVVTVVENFITNVTEYVTNQITNVTEYVTNVYNTTEQYITNVMGASKEYVDNLVSGIDTVGFFKDPLGYIGAAFSGLIEFWIHGIIKSFEEGLEEGLEATEES